MITLSTSNPVIKLAHVPVSFIPTPNTMQQDIYDQENFNFIQQEDRNWSERILQDVIGLLHILSPTGKVLYCSESCIELTGYSPFELIGKSLTDFIHTDDLDIFARNFQRKDNTYVLLESIGHPKQNVPHQPPQSFFGIAQPYLSRSNGLMDSFLELKMENEWLKKRLNQLIQDTTYQAVQPPPPPQYGHQYFQTDDRRPSNCSSILFQTNNGPDDHSWNSPPDEFNELLRYNQEDYLSSSNSVTTNTDKWKRRKKHRSVDDYVCSDCGTSASPEWRKGPHGPKTLCNACGLRWAKKNKKI